MGFGGKKSDPAPAPRSKPDQSTYAPAEREDPVNTQLGIDPSGSNALLAPDQKPKSTPLLG